MWKPVCALPDGSDVTLPESIQTDEQAAFFYGGLAFALIQDMQGGKLTSEEKDRAVALGMEIAQQFQQDGLGTAFMVSALDDLIGEDDTPISPEAPHHVRHRAVHGARRKAA